MGTERQDKAGERRESASQRPQHQREGRAPARPDDAHTHAFGGALKDALHLWVTTELDMFTDHTYAAQTRKPQVRSKDLDWPSAQRRHAGHRTARPRHRVRNSHTTISSRTRHKRLSTRAMPKVRLHQDHLRTMAAYGSRFRRQQGNHSRGDQGGASTGQVVVVHIGTLRMPRRDQAALTAGAPFVTLRRRELPRSPPSIMPL